MAETYSRTAHETSKEWVGTALDTDTFDPRGIKKIVVEYDEGEETLTPRLNERFGSYDLYEAAAYLDALRTHLIKGM